MTRRGLWLYQLRFRRRLLAGVARPPVTRGSTHSATDALFGGIARQLYSGERAFSATRSNQLSRELVELLGIEPSRHCLQGRPRQPIRQPQSGTRSED